MSSHLPQGQFPHLRLVLHHLLQALFNSCLDVAICGDGEHKHYHHGGRVDRVCRSPQTSKYPRSPLYLADEHKASVCVSASKPATRCWHSRSKIRRTTPTNRDCHAIPSPWLNSLCMLVSAALSPPHLHTFLCLAKEI